MEIVPYKFNVSGLFIFDRVTQYPAENEEAMKSVLAENGTHYNVWNPLFKAENKTEARGVLRSHLKPVIQKIGKNVYNGATTIVLNNEKLPKNTQALAGLLTPLVTSVENGLPFKPDFVMTTNQIKIVVGTEDNKEFEAPVKEPQKAGDLVFSNYIGVSGWVTTSGQTEESPLLSVNLTTCMTVFASPMKADVLFSDMTQIETLISESCANHGHVGALFNSSRMTKEDYDLVKNLLGKGFHIVTLNTQPSIKWLPPTKTAQEEKLFTSLGGILGDFLLVK